RRFLARRAIVGDLRPAPEPLVGRDPRGGRYQLRGRRRQDAGAARALGLRQVHHPPPHRRSRSGHERAHPDRRGGGGAPAPGRAIIAETAVCLMDEPLSNLDAQLRHDMRREIRGIQQKLGITMVYVTHDQTEAMSMADQVILLRDGRVEQDAPPAELYARPASVFAARFIGTPPMNILSLADSPGGAVIAGTAGPVVLPGRGGGLSLAVRPDDRRLGPAGGLGATV